MEQQEYELMSRVEYTHWWFRAKREYLKTYLPNSSTRKRIVLDVGAGTGAISAYLGEWGDVTRLESSSIAISYLKQKGLSYLKEDINTYAFPIKKFDIVTCLDVLYHKNIRDDEAVLKKIYRSLKPGGILLVTDCALPFLMSKHDVRNHARQRYTVTEMTQKIESAGFKVEKASYIYFFIFPLTVFSRFIERYTQSSDVNLPHPILNTFLFGICLAESYMLKIASFPIGSSIIVKATK